MKSRFLFYLIIVILCNGFTVLSEAAPAVEKKENEKKISLLLQEATDVSKTKQEKWLGYIIESALTFKFDVIENFELITPQNAASHGVTFKKTGEPLSDAQYITMAKKAGAQYVGKPKFEISQSKDVFYYLEIVSAANGEMVTTIDRECKLNQLGSTIDEIVNDLVKFAKITISKDLIRFQRTPAVGSDIKSLRMLGECIETEFRGDRYDAELLARNYRMVCEKDRSMLIAFWQGGQFFEKAGKYSDAAEAMNVLLMELPEYIPVYLPLCRNYRKAKRFDDALRIAMLADMKSVDKSSLLLEKAEIFEALGKKTEAENAFQQILKSDPENAQALMYCARKANKDGNHKLAFDYCTRVTKKGIQNADISFETAKSLQGLNRNVEAVAAYQKTIEFDNKNIHAYVFLAENAFKLKNYQNAAQYYDQVLTLAVDNSAYCLDAAISHEKSGNSVKALEILKSGELKNSGNGQYMQQMGLLELAAKDSTRAKKHFEAAVRLNISSVDVIYPYGWLCLKNKEFDIALSMFTKALPSVKDKLECKKGMALAQINLGNTKAAYALLDELAVQNYKATGVYSLLAERYYSQKEKAPALKFFKREALLGKNTKEIQEKIADLSYELSSAQESHKEYLKLLEMGAGNSVANYRLAVLSLQLKDKGSAVTYLARASKFGSTDESTYYKLGNGFNELGATKEALSAFQNCVKANGQNENAWMKMLAIYEKTGRDSMVAEVHMQLYALNNEKYKNNLVTAGKLFESKNYKKLAKSAYRQFVDKKYVNSEVNIRLAKLEYADSNYTAIPPLLQGIAVTQMDNQLLVVGAEVAYKQEQYQKVLTYTKTIIARLPNDKRANELSALASEKAGSIEAAISYYKKYLLIVKSHQNYAFHLGELYEKVKYFTDAVSLYENNCRQYPKDFRNFDRLVRIYYSQKKWSGVISSAKKAVMFKEAGNDIQLMYARALAADGKKDDSRVHYRQYLLTAQKDTAAWYELGMLHFESKEYAEAGAALTSASSGMSKNYDVFRNGGIAWYKSGSFDKAVAMLTKAIELRQGNIEIYTMLADCLRKSGQKEMLIKVLTEWCHHDKKNFDIRQELAETYFADSKFDEASALYEECVVIKPCAIDLRFTLASIYETVDKADKWIGHLRNALQCEGKNPDIYYEISRYFEYIKDTSRSEDYLQQTLKLSSEHGEANYKMGVYKYRRGQYNDAFTYLNKAVKANPVVTNCIALIEVLQKLGRTKDALSVARPLLRRENVDIRVVKWAGLLYRDAGYPDSARQYLQRAVSMDKKCSDCHSALGDLAFGAGNYTDAIKAYQSALDMGAGSEETSLNLARAYIQIGKKDGARKTLQELNSKSPANMECIYRLCNVLLMGNEIIEAERTLQRAVDIKSYWYFLADGEINEKAGKLADAMTMYQKALRKKGDLSEAQAGCGRISLARKNYNDAIMHFAMAMAGDPENCQLMLDMGQAYEGTKDYVTAMDLYKDVARRQPDNPDVPFFIARIVSKKQDHAQAIATIKDGISRNKKNAILYLGLGNEYRITNQIKDAIAAYEKAVSLDERKCVDAYKHLGSIHDEKGDKKKAKEYYAKYINAGGQDNAIKRLLQLYNSQ
jgi:FimV-like protein